MNILFTFVMAALAFGIVFFIPSIGFAAIAALLAVIICRLDELIDK